MSGWVSASCKSTTKTLSRSEIVWFCPCAHTFSHTSTLVLTLNFYLSDFFTHDKLANQLMRTKRMHFPTDDLWHLPSLLPLNLLMRDFSLHAPLMSIYGQLPCTSCPLYTLYSSCTLPQHCLAVFDTAVCFTLQCAVCSVVGTMGGHRLWMRDCRPLPYQMPSLHTQCSWPS